MNYTTEFLTIALVHFLAVASPGPDFAVVLKHSVGRGRRDGLLTSLGIGLGIFVHVAYCVVGLGVLISQSILLFNVVKFAGAAYLIFIGLAALRSKRRDISEHGPAVGDRKAGPFAVGFLTNVLNPKATLFFLSVFSVVVSPQTPISVQFAYGFWMAFATFAWFATLSLFFSVIRVRAFFAQFGHFFDRFMGVVLLGMGVRLALIEAGD